MVGFFTPSWFCLTVPPPEMGNQDVTCTRELPKPLLPKPVWPFLPSNHPSPIRASAQALTFCTRFRAVLKWAIILSTAVLTAINRAAGQQKGRSQHGNQHHGRSSICSAAPWG